MLVQLTGILGLASRSGWDLCRNVGCLLDTEAAGIAAGSWGCREAVELG